MATVLSMSMSLDGFIAGPNAGPGNGLGDGGHRLHEWAMTAGHVDLQGTSDRGGVNGQIVDESMSTGAVVAGRGTFEPAGGWGGDHHDGVPIWVLSRHEPGIDVSQWPLVTYVDDVTIAMTEAKRGAGDRNVLVHGAAVARGARAAPRRHAREKHHGPPSRWSSSAPGSSRETASPTCTTASGADAGPLRLLDRGDVDDQLHLV